MSPKEKMMTSIDKPIPQRKLRSLALLGAACLSTACGAAESGRVATKVAAPTQLSGDAQPARLRIDPEAATVTLATSPFLSPASEESSFRAPTLLMGGLEQGTTDYVQIARCQKGTELKTSTGVALTAIPADSALRLDHLKWIWTNRVWANTQQCRIVGGASARIARERFQDLSAPEGEFFYVLNPCLQEDHSNQKEVCSYNLVVSSPLQQPVAMKARFLATAEKLSQAEGILAGHYSRIYYATQAIRRQQDACENNHAVTVSSQNFWKGVASLSLGSVGAVVGGIVSGGTASLEGFKTGLGLAVGFFKKQPEAPLVCSAVDGLIQQSREASEKLEPALANILALRSELSALESSYARIDTQQKTE